MSLCRYAARFQVRHTSFIEMRLCTCLSIVYYFLLSEYESYFEYYYNKPYTRCGPYLLGILAGIYMVTKKEDLIKQRVMFTR